LELQKEQQDRFVLTRQCLLDALLENVEKALGRRPVRVGEEGREFYVYRGDVANTALRRLAYSGIRLRSRTERNMMTFPILNDAVEKVGFCCDHPGY
jgi:hypothetical protein